MPRKRKQKLEKVEVNTEKIKEAREIPSRWAVEGNDRVGEEETNKTNTISTPEVQMTDIIHTHHVNTCQHIGKMSRLRPVSDSLENVGFVSKGDKKCV